MAPAERIPRWWIREDRGNENRVRRGAGMNRNQGAGAIESPTGVKRGPG